MNANLCLENECSQFKIAVTNIIIISNNNFFNACGLSQYKPQLKILIWVASATLAIML